MEVGVLCLLIVHDCFCHVPSHFIEDHETSSLINDIVSMKLIADLSRASHVLLGTEV
jgi:hypothetical protein